MNELSRNCHCPPECPRCGRGMDRRDFLRLAGLGSLGLWAASLRAGAEPTDPAHRGLIPADKNLEPAWLKSLTERGAPSVYRGDDLKYIGMPIGGICAGQMYLSGEGKLWHWDIFNHIYDSGCTGPQYTYPFLPAKNSPVDQGFALQITSGSQAGIHTLDATGFPDLSFCGEYPVATVEYKNSALPVEVTLEAFSPFIPLNTDDSSFPATVFRFTVKNTSSDLVEATLAGWLENVVCAQHRSTVANWSRRNQIVPGAKATFLNCSLESPASGADLPDVVIEDWSKPTYDGWTVEGTAFGSGPILKTDLPKYMGDVGGDTDRVVNSHATAPGDTPAARDAQTGKLTSAPFTIQRDYIKAWVGGGNNIEQVSFRIMVDGQPVVKTAGPNNNFMELRQFDVQAWKGKQATIEITDNGTGPWGNIGVGRIFQTGDPKTFPDFGTMGLALLGEPAEQGMPSGTTNGFGGKAADADSVSGDQSLVGSVGRKLSLAPGQSATVDFVLTWHFPNLTIHRLGPVGRSYASKFASAQAVAQAIADDFPRLSAETRLWHDTWYDSTLPYWFLDRTFSSVSTLATSTPYRFANGRFYSWEGVGSCDGTCTHVWGYAHSIARTFPELERITREHVDYGISLDPATGVVGFRGEFNRGLAVDGQAGVLLRTYREHQMTADNAFLQRVWPQVKKAFDPLLALDADRDGILQGAQMNTLDLPWYGQVAWMSSLYVAALRAGEQMATEMGDADFAALCRSTADNGSQNITAKLFNGEYFINLLDPQHPDIVNSGTGCEIDQVFGQGWGWQLGLPRVLPEKETQSALQALWKYNFAPDVGPYMAAYREHRVYAAAGEAGTLLCTFPQPGWDYKQACAKSPAFAVRYFNEVWTGTEHQVAGHMIWEGLVQEGLAVERAVHDRHHPSKRNPWNEIECGDHYSRAMASYGVYIAASGYEYHGPKGELGFAPRLTPENFRAAFTAAEGWGTFSQQIQNNRLAASLELKWGRLALNQMTLTVPAGATVGSVQVEHNGQKIQGTLQQTDRRIAISLPSGLTLQAKDELKFTLS